MYPEPATHRTKHCSVKSFANPRNSLEYKMAPFFSKDQPVPQHEEIFMESSENENDHQMIGKEEGNSAIFPTMKVQSSEEKLPSEHSDLYSFPSSLRCYNLHKLLSEETFLKSETYHEVEEVDFKIYHTFLAKTRIYGGALIDNKCKLLWCDKMTHELLEGSLNNFEKRPITNLFLNTSLEYFLNQLKSIRKYDDKTIVHWIIYSKNSKRKYKNVALNKNLSQKEIFYRFLKALTVRIRPISICLPTFRDSNGFCNQDLMPKHYPISCFFLEIRLSKRPPDLHKFDIINDPTIGKYIQNERQKHLSTQHFEGSNRIKKAQPVNFQSQDSWDKMEEGKKKEVGLRKSHIVIKRDSSRTAKEKNKQGVQSQLLMLN